MKIFLDTADVKEITALAETGLVDGVTTNPSLILKSGQPILPTIRAICGLVAGPVSAEVVSDNYDGMLAEGLRLAEIAPNVIVKVPLTMTGLQVCRTLRARNIGVNVTLCFSVHQAMMAAKAGATFVSPFMGRLDESGASGIEVVKGIAEAFRQYPNLTTQVLASSIRNADYVSQVAQVGVGAMTCSPAIFRTLYDHLLTTKGIEMFAADWAKTGEKI